MNKLPTECRARHREILHRASYLLEMFINGNRGDTTTALQKMEEKVSFAVLANMMRNADEDTAVSLTNYFTEVA